MANRAAAMQTFLPADPKYAAGYVGGGGGANGNNKKYYQEEHEAIADDEVLKISHMSSLIEFDVTTEENIHKIVARERHMHILHRPCLFFMSVIKQNGKLKQVYNANFDVGHFVCTIPHKVPYDDEGVQEFLNNNAMNQTKKSRVWGMSPDGKHLEDYDEQTHGPLRYTNKSEVHQGTRYIIELFDPLGAQLGSDCIQPMLDNLKQRALSGSDIVMLTGGKTRYEALNLETCGRWTGLRLYYRGLSAQEFKEGIEENAQWFNLNKDNLITAKTDTLLKGADDTVHNSGKLIVYPRG